MENVLFNITKTLNSMQSVRPIPSNPDIDENWSTSAAPNNLSDINSSSIRWDNIKPFPTGVPANKMWEEWNRYIENFEIAASLSNANDPARRSQLLFLSIGAELQGIVRAAKLRPNLNNVNCYKNFVTNIQEYFQSMTDSAAEHESFSNMKQESSETAIAFHARLMTKVRMCGYSPSDQDRFVRAQLLKGLRNKELVKSARTYGHDTNYIVQAATRNEAYEAEAAASDQFELRRSEPYAVNRVHQQQTKYGFSRKRPNTEGWKGKTQAKRFKNNQQTFRRDVPRETNSLRCRRCNFPRHAGPDCPATNRKCNICGLVGHYAVVCRKTRIRQIEVKASTSPTRNDDMDHTQVLND